MNIKKIIILAAIFAANVWAMNWSESQISISTEAQLREFAAQVNNGNDFSGQTITLENDIELVGGNWVPIGYLYWNASTEEEIPYFFNGTFDGNGNAIKNIYINSLPYDDIYALYSFSVGFFGINNGTIKNIRLVNLNIVEIDSVTSLGGLLGINGNDGRIENVFVQGNIEATAHCIGGLVGMNMGTVTASYTDMNLKSDLLYIDDEYFTHIGMVGGLVGDNETGLIENSFTIGSASSYGVVGGLVGESGGRIINSYSMVNVFLLSDDQRGVVGSLSGFNSLITGSTAFVGEIVSSYALRNNSVELIGVNNSDNVCPNSALKTAEQLRQQSTFIGWDFENIWAIDPSTNNGFPFLRSFSNGSGTSISRNPTTSRKTANTARFAGIRNGQITLNLNAGNYTVELFNLQGRLIGSANINAINGLNSVGIISDNLAKGVFILNVRQAQNSVLRQRVAVW